MNKNRNRKGILAGLMGGLFWGFDPHIMTLLLLMVPFVGGDTAFKLGLIGAAGMAAFFKEIFTLIFVTGAHVARKEIRGTFSALSTKKGRSAWAWVAFSAMFSGPIATTLYAVSVGFAGPAWPAMITSIYPVIAAIGGAIILKDKLSLKGWIGVSLVGVGMVTLALTNPSSDALPLLSIGILTSIVTAIAWGSEGVILSIGLRNSDLTSMQCIFIRSLTSTFIYAALVVPIIAMPDGYRFVAEVLRNPVTLLITMVFALNMLIDLIFYYRSIDLIGPAKAASLNVTYVIFALVFGFLLHSLFPSYPFTPPTWVFYLVGAFIVTGVILVVGPGADAKDSALVKAEVSTVD